MITIGDEETPAWRQRMERKPRNGIFVKFLMLALVTLGLGLLWPPLLVILLLVTVVVVVVQLLNRTVTPTEEER